MSSTVSSHSSSASPMPPPPPPPPAVDNDPSTSQSARKHLEPTSRFPLSLSTPNLRHGVKSKRSKTKFRSPFRTSTITTPGSTHETNEDSTSAQPIPDIALNDQPIHVEEKPDENDRYEWAVLYENQRGITLFSVPHYSSNSLLPTDPPPFTLPTASVIPPDAQSKVKRSTQPSIDSLNDYPLPDGNWRWVSRSWMIDMRSDSGEVQHDGFEYNWVFRKHHWRAQTGTLSSGGYVRRRRWVRLMVRPGTKTREGEEMAESIASPTESPSAPSLRSSWVERQLSPGRRRQSMPASVLSPGSLAASVVSGSAMSDQSVAEMWQGNVEEDWNMCKYLLREAARDGAKLELWKRWLGLETNDTKEPDSSTTSLLVPPIDYVKDILRVHGIEIVESFIFPESRARFIAFLEQASVYGDLQRGLDPSWSLASDAGLAFWSLNSEVDLVQEKGKDESTDPTPDST